MYQKGFQFLLFLWVIALPMRGHAQDIPLGTWRDHVSYRATHTLTIAQKQQRVFAASSSGLFWVDDEGIQTLTKTQGLSGAQIDQIAYCDALELLVVTYRSGKIDLIDQHQKIFPILDIFADEELVGKTKVYHILIRKHLAYLSTSFGVVVVDLKRQEIKESYLHLGPSGQSIPVLATALTQDQIFLATSRGIQYAPLSANLQYHGSYTRFESSSGIPQEATQGLVFHDSKLYASINGKGIYQYDFTDWTMLADLTGLPSYTLQSSQQDLLVCASSNVYKLDNDSFTTVATLTSPKQAVIDKNKNLWVADAKTGLWQINATTSKQWLPDGLLNGSPWGGIYYNDKILMISGGYNQDLNPLGRPSNVDLFDGRWQSIQDIGGNSTIKDIVEAHYQAPNLYLASFGQGVLALTKDDTLLIHDELELSPTDPALITAVSTDAQGKLWIGQYADNTPIHVRDQDRYIALASIINPPTQYPLEITPDLDGHMWIRMDPKKGGGIWVWDQAIRQNRYLNTVQGLKPRVGCVTTDLKGRIWIGTNDGVQVVQNAFEVFENGFQVETPIFTGFPLLRDHIITKITIDGGDRKWIGTQGDGAFLFDKNASELLAHFTTQNSPLPSDNILDIVIHPRTGEVFFVTDKGLVSFRSDATSATKDFSTLRIFPNPVGPHFDGKVTIQGLAKNAHIKITDIAGQLVFETDVQGGTATWNLQNYNGQKVQTGVYTILASNEDGTEGIAGKIAVVR